MIEAPDWFVWTFDLLLILAIIVGLIFLKAWWNVRQFKGKNTMKIIAEITELSGRRVRHIVEPDKTSATVTIYNKVYMLPKELTKGKLTALEGKKVPIVPSRQWVEIPNWPLPSIPVRIESWDYDNPEPKRAFYGRVDEKGMFVDNQLTVTSTEWHIQKSAMKAAELGAFYQEMSTMAAVWQRAMANLPNKIVVYVGLGIAALGSIIAVVILYQIAMG